MKSNIITFDTPYFWAGYFASHFGQIAEPIEFEDVAEIFNISEKAALEWWHQFTNFYEGVFDECDGQVEEPGLITICNNEITLLFEFHPGGTYLFISNPNEEKIKLGNIGPHWELPSFRWEEACKFFNITGGWREFLLFLPWVWIEKSNWEDKFKEPIINALMNFTSGTKASKFYEKWFNAVASEYVWKKSNNIGWVSDAQWSKRFYKNNLKQLQLINSMIEQFIKGGASKSVI